jgi:hypothetical protein
LCLQRGEAANVRLSWEAIGGKIIVVISHRNMLPTSEHTRARTSPFLCCKSEQSRGRKLHSYKIKQHHTGARKNTAFSFCAHSMRDNELPMHGRCWKTDATPLQ